MMKEYVKKNGFIPKWDEGMPLGNGELGALFYGENTLLCALDKAGLWDTRPEPETKEPAFRYSEMVRLAKSDEQADWTEFLRLFSGCYSHTTPTKINAGTLALDFPYSKDTSFLLDTESATLEITNAENRLLCFVGAKSDLGYILSEKPIDVKVVFPEYFYEPYLNRRKNSLDTAGEGLGYKKPVLVEEDGIVYHVQTTEQDGVFAVALRKTREKEGDLLAFAVLVGNTTEELLEKGKKAFSVDYSKDREAHLAHWREFWSESSLSLPDKRLQRLYVLSYYLFGSGNKKGGLPMPLQGVWTACDGNLPPWKGDYHHDLNTQFTYVSYLRANHLQTGRVFVDYLWEMREKFRAFAKDFYGVKGILAPAVSSVDGQPLGGWPMYSLSPTMSIWLAQSFADYYEATQDEEFFKERAYPFFYGVTEAILGLLEEKNGRLYLPLSSSPEYNDCTPAAFFDWSNNDLQLVRYALEKMSEYNQKLGKSEGKYQRALAKLHTPYVDEKGVLLLDSEQYVAETHRHHSNLMCIYPLKTLKAEQGKNVPQIEENLLYLETLGTGLWVGFSYPWFAALSAMGYFGNRALHHLQVFEKCFVADNGFHLNGDFKKYGVSNFHYRPFTLESNYVFCAALQEMLVQDHDGYLHLFPCIPDDWQGEEISFDRFLSRGCLLSAKWKEGSAVFFEIRSNIPRVVPVKNVFGRKTLQFSNGQVVDCPEGEIFNLNVTSDGCRLL